ncbi:MAG: hypothetical protein ACP5NX_04515 [Candidatus Bilamarchaeaceae archaeon]
MSYKPMEEKEKPLMVAEAQSKAVHDAQYSRPFLSRRLTVINERITTLETISALNPGNDELTNLVAVMRQQYQQIVDGQAGGKSIKTFEQTINVLNTGTENAIVKYQKPFDLKVDELREFNYNNLNRMNQTNFSTWIDDDILNAIQAKDKSLHKKLVAIREGKFPSLSRNEANDILRFAAECAPDCKLLKNLAGLGESSVSEVLKTMFLSSGSIDRNRFKKNLEGMAKEAWASFDGKVNAEFKKFYANSPAGTSREAYDYFDTECKKRISSEMRAGKSPELEKILDAVLDDTFKKFAVTDGSACKGIINNLFKNNLSPKSGLLAAFDIATAHTAVEKGFVSWLKESRLSLKNASQLAYYGIAGGLIAGFAYFFGPAIYEYGERASKWVYKKVKAYTTTEKKKIEPVAKENTAPTLQPKDNEGEIQLAIASNYDTWVNKFGTDVADVLNKFPSKIADALAKSEVNTIDKKDGRVNVLNALLGYYNSLPGAEPQKINTFINVLSGSVGVTVAGYTFSKVNF